MRVWPKAYMAAALWSGLLVALALLAMPVGLIETIVASSGLSEALPAAAPPLGMKARLLLAAFGAVTAAGVIWSGHEDRAQRGQIKRRLTGVRGVSKMSFALPKLGWLARGRTAGSPRDARRMLRRADAHPDAPARSPIFASRDFGGIDIFPRNTPAQAEEGRPFEPRQTAALALPAAPLQTDGEGSAGLSAAEDHPFSTRSPVDAEFEEIDVPAIHHPAPAARPAPASQPMSLSQLTERLEEGLAQRARKIATTPRASTGFIADMPVERPVPVRDRLDDDVDQALRAALSALRTMVGRTR